MKKPSPQIIAGALRNQAPELYETIVQECMAEPFQQTDIDTVWENCQLDKDRTRLVIAICLRRYSPQTLAFGLDVRQGLAAAIAKSKGVGQPAVSKLVQEVAQWYRTYEEFRNKVDRIVERFKNEN